MKKSEFRIRDPYILLHEGKYYMYGTTRFDAGSIFSSKGGFDVYVSEDLENFSGPYQVFEPGKDFYAIGDFWAPEVHRYKGRFYMFATFKGEGGNHGTGILVADSPLGPFTPHSEMPLTPSEWSALDGTLYIDKEGAPYMVFCHEWWSMGGDWDGTMCYARLSDDLTHITGDIVTMFAASESPFVRVTSRGYGYITDGPCMYRTKTDELLMLWSSKGERGYMECVYRSDNGEIDGNFVPVSILYPDDGGHGMIFEDKEGKLNFTLHAPNVSGEERSTIFPLCDLGDDIVIG